MQLINNAALATATLVACATAQSTFETVYGDVTSIYTHVETLISATNALNSDLLDDAPFLADFTAVYAATEKGAADAALLPSELPSDEAVAIITHVNDTLSVVNPAAVSALEAKKVYFEEYGLDDAVAAGLGLLLNGHLTFSDEVLARLPADLLAEGQEVVNVITTALENGIADFSS